MVIIISSTNRSKARNEHISDYYITPIHDIEIFLNEFSQHVNINWSDIRILDPCAGGNKEIIVDGRVFELYHPMSYPTALNNVFGKCSIQSIDIRKDSLAEIKTDYLKYNIDEESRPQVIITNPPFNIAMNIIQKALTDVDENGYVIMLLRLNFFGSKERKSFFESYMPEWSFVHHIRIGFADKKDDDGFVVFDKNGNPKRAGTDSIEYMHAVWRKGHNPDYTKLVLL